MDDIMLKPNLAIFRVDNENGTEDTISINAFEIVSIIPKHSVLKEDRKKVVIRLRNGILHTVLGTVQELHSKILKS